MIQISNYSAIFLTAEFSYFTVLFRARVDIAIKPIPSSIIKTGSGILEIFILSVRNFKLLIILKTKKIIAAIKVYELYRFASIKNAGTSIVSNNCM